MIFLHCGTLADFGELSFNILICEWSKANKKSSLELLPRGNPVIGLVPTVPLDPRKSQLSDLHLPTLEIPPSCPGMEGSSTSMGSDQGWLRLRGLKGSSVDVGRNRCCNLLDSSVDRCTLGCASTEEGDAAVDRGKGQRWCNYGRGVMTARPRAVVAVAGLQEDGCKILKEKLQRRSVVESQRKRRGSLL
ncbi:hypothetical protein B296_00019879 [Ensete ventricosum]|uniref:Uncharacterized protein n=1 Tax=Ensete ventricosum TaxID=4639 RepID=A0A426YVP0_ENSVE|nr:hypothetical protein B296_00019879 [Ensete ventricosum]